MSQRPPRNAEHESFAAGGRSGGVGHASRASRTNTMLPGARDVRIADSTLTVVGGDVYNYHLHGSSEPSKDIWAILKSIPNFRRIYLDMLSKATLGTGMWLVRGDKFRVWLEPNGDIKIFWGSGIPGAGKTLLASIVIEHLEALRQNSDSTICVCYIYFRYSDRSEVTVRDILESLVKQTLERHPGCLSVIDKTYAQHLREGTEPTEGQLLGLLRELADGMSCTFYILDALDEAPTKVQLAVVKALASLNVKLFITSRPLEPLQAHFPQAHTFAIIAQDTDLDLHITKGIDESVDLQRMLRANPSLRDEIFSTIKQNCGSMFLLASLQLDALCECANAYEVRQRLKEFPSSIEDVYLQTWDRIIKQNAHHASLAKIVLVWVLNASRSMTVEELERAVATCPDTYKFEPDRLVPGTTLMSLCRGLVTVEEESGVVRLVHYTAKETLGSLLHATFPHPHSLLAAVCMAHLTDCGFQNTSISSVGELKAALSKTPLLLYASKAWAFHASQSLDVDDSKHRIAQFINGSRAFPVLVSGSSFDILTPVHIIGLYCLPLALISNTIEGNPNVVTAVRRQSTLIVASQCGHEDLVAYLITLSTIDADLVDTGGHSALMLAAYGGHEGIVKHLLVSLEVQVNLVNKDGWSALTWAASEGHEGVVKLILVHPKVQVNLVNNGGWSALIRAAYVGHEGVVRLLLAHPETQVNLVDKEGWSALMRAASKGHEGIAKLLLAHPELQVNLVANGSRSALMHAASEGREGVLKLLLMHPKIQLNLVDNNGWSALMRAAVWGKDGVAKLLLAQPNIQVNLVSNNGWSALTLAASNGREGIVKLLLAYPETQVNPVVNNGWPALIGAASEGHEGIVKLLIEHPEIQVNLVYNSGLSALIKAACQGHEGIVKLLLMHLDIQINLVDNNGWSALMWAASKGHEGIFKLLLVHPNIQINLVSNNGWPAVMWAAYYGHEGPFKLLLEHPDIQVNLVDNYGWSAFMLATFYGYEGIAKLLLAHPKIQVNLVDNNGWTALMQAASKGHEGVVKLLLVHPNIQVNLVDIYGWSALMQAASEGHEGVAKLLLAHPEPQANLANNHGSTALLLAAQYGHTEIVDSLLTTGAFDVNAFDNDGDTAIKMAADKGHEAIVRLLLNLPDVDITIRSVQDGHTAMSAAQANGHNEIVQLLQDFESQNSIIMSPPQTRQLSLHNEDGSNSDSEDVYHDAESGDEEDSR